ncbi:Myb-like DNA-binding domain containing protein [Histomonas meleagridis]|uniref:Myb-like DNA-binding domain containing protein n=1 Tax=Histomonas meleagridis TaxID=135588 RepID=UPI00355A65FE|nr:Myb-like DNA-binding domain containing protein [Histomonas meleagridis]KAH0805962.1 Myb-like DNA-binding domain containing protein [Histomonas meleagridis]
MEDVYSFIESLEVKKVQYKDVCEAYAYIVGYSWGNREEDDFSTKESKIIQKKLEDQVKELSVKLPGKSAKESQNSTKREILAGKRVPILWNEKEIDGLKKGVEKYGFGAWTKICSEFQVFRENGRTPKDLCDKAHSYRKSNEEFRKICEEHPNNLRR